MTKYRYDSIIAHEVETPREFRPSSYFRRRMPIAGKPGSYRLVPARRVDCPHCGEELHPARFEGVSYRECPNACMDTFAEASNRRAGQFEDVGDAPPVFDVQGRL